jgi:hypothetical protein
MYANATLLSGVSNAEVSITAIQRRTFQAIIGDRLAATSEAMFWQEFETSCRLAAGARLLHAHNKTTRLRTKLRAAHKLASSLCDVCCREPFKAEQRRSARALSRRLVNTIGELPPGVTSLGVAADMQLVVAELDARLEVVGALGAHEMAELKALLLQLNGAVTKSRSLPNGRRPLFYRDMLAAGIARAMAEAGLKPTRTRDDVEYQRGDSSYASLLRLAIEIVEGASPVEIFAHQVNGLDLLAGSRKTKQGRVQCCKLLS